MVTTYPSNTVEAAVIALSDHCDHAHSRDRVGFNGTDARWANALAQRLVNGERASEIDIARAYRMLKKYARQLAAYGVDYGSIAEPALSTRDNRPVSQRGTIARFGGTCASCGFGCRVRRAHDCVGVVMDRLTNIRGRLRSILDGVSPDMHEPDQWEVVAHVIGDHLDNAFGESITYKLTKGDFGQYWGRQEFLVIIERDLSTEVFNLADIIALARMARDPSTID